MPTAISTASRPNSVVNLMIGFSATDDVSLKGSPTVSPTTVAACSGVPFSFSSTSTIFLALSRPLRQPLAFFWGYPPPPPASQKKTPGKPPKGAGEPGRGGKKAGRGDQNP